MSDGPEGSRFGFNVTEFERAYPGWVLRGDGIGLIAWRRNESGRASGSPIRARTLDELADQIPAILIAADRATLTAGVAGGFRHWDWASHPCPASANLRGAHGRDRIARSHEAGE